MKKENLFVDEISPEPSLGSLVRIRGKQGSSVMPNLVDVLHDDEGLADGFSVVDENRDLLVDRVHLQKKRTLVP